MNLPDNWTLVPVRGTFLDLHGSPCRGSVVFSSDQVVIVDGLVVVPRLIIGTLDETGTVSVMLPSTTDPDTAPTGWVYTVIEHIRPAGRPPFRLAVPHDAGEINLDTAPIAPPVDPVDPTPYVGPRGRSAYQIAVDEGYIGSEAEWLASLVGPEGPQGPPGGGGGGADLSDNAPHALGTAAAGTGTKASRDDHVHAMPTASDVGADASGAATAAVASHVGAADPHPQYTTPSEAAAVAPVQTVAGRTGNVTLAVADVSGAVDTADARLSDAREWTASTVTQAEAEAGADTTRKAWTVQRVWQAIAAWWAGSADKAKLDGIAAGAEVNVNADWSAGSGDALILNKPTLGTAASHDVGDFATAAQGAKADSALQPNTPITGATKTKITYDADGLVTGGADATPSDVGLGSVTNDAQTKAAIMPNTAPAAGRIPVGNAGGTAYAPVAVSGDATLSSAGALTVGSNKISYAKMQDVSAASKLLGRGDSGSGDPQEITIGSGLTMTGTTLSASGGGGGSPGGSDKQLQYNNAGVFGGAASAYWDAANGRLSVGAGTSPAGVVHAKAASASNVVSIFQGTTSQTGNLSEWRDSSGTVVSRVTAAGVFSAGEAYTGTGLWVGGASYHGSISLRGDPAAMGQYGIGYNSSLDATFLFGYTTRKFALGMRDFDGTYRARFTFDDSDKSWAHFDGVNYAFGTTTGTKFGTATNQKLSFWNATPVVQPANASQAAITDTAGATYTSTEQTMLANLKTLVNQLRADLVTIGIIKGAA